MKELIYVPERSETQASTFIYENSSNEYIPHDALFKTLLKNYFKQFIQAFFPEIYEVLDFA